MTKATDHHPGRTPARVKPLPLQNSSPSCPTPARHAWLLRDGHLLIRGWSPPSGLPSATALGHLTSTGWAAVRKPPPQRRTELLSGRGSHPTALGGQPCTAQVGWSDPRAQSKVRVTRPRADGVRPSGRRDRESVPWECGPRALQQKPLRSVRSCPRSPPPPHSIGKDTEVRL